VASIVCAKEGAYIITLCEHIAKYGAGIYEAVMTAKNFVAGIYDKSPVTFIQSINSYKRACLNYGIIIYFRPTPGFDINNTVVNFDAINLKYAVNYFDEQDKILNKYKSAADMSELDYSAFDKVKYIFNMEVLFWVIFNESNKPDIAPEQEIIFQQPFNTLDQNTYWAKSNPRIKFALVYFPRDALLSSTPPPLAAVDFVFAEYPIKWLILLSPNIIFVAQKNAPIYGPINRTTMKPF
jgi:hypothetical protein